MTSDPDFTYSVPTTVETKSPDHAAAPKNSRKTFQEERAPAGQPAKVKTREQQTSSAEAAVLMEREPMKKATVALAFCILTFTLGNVPELTQKLIEKLGG